MSIELARKRAKKFFQYHKLSLPVKIDELLKHYADVKEAYIPVDGDAICRLSQLYPCRFMVYGAVAFLQKDDVTDNISARIGAECVVWQADCSQQIRTLRKWCVPSSFRPAR